MPGQHKHTPLRFRPPEAERLWLEQRQAQTGDPMNAILTQAVRALMSSAPSPEAARPVLPPASEWKSAVRHSLDFPAHVLVPYLDLDGKVHVWCDGDGSPDEPSSCDFKTEPPPEPGDWPDRGAAEAGP